VADILEAGAGAGSPGAARLLAEEGPRLIEEVLVHSAGVEFDRDPDGALAWGQEAAHSHRRILHVGDTTGRAIAAALADRLRRCPNVRLITNATAIDLITFPHHSRDPQAAYQPLRCHGAYAFDRNDRSVHRFLAGATILATGGLGRIYKYTTNPAGARGDGLAMAHRAGGLPTPNSCSSIPLRWRRLAPRAS
jgi:L-aspartate oxidase